MHVCLPLNYFALKSQTNFIYLYCSILQVHNSIFFCKNSFRKPHKQRSFCSATYLQYSFSNYIVNNSISCLFFLTVFFKSITLDIIRNFATKIL